MKRLVWSIALLVIPVAFIAFAVPTNGQERDSAPNRDEVVGVLKPGIEVRFGAVDPRTRLAKLVSVLRVKKELEQYTYFDLRFDSQVVYF